MFVVTKFEVEALVVEALDTAKLEEFPNRVAKVALVAIRLVNTADREFST